MNEKIKTVTIEGISSLTDEEFAEYFKLVEAEKLVRIKTQVKTIWQSVKTFGTYAKNIAIFIAAIGVIVFVVKQI